MIKVLIKCLEVIRSVNGSIGTFFIRVAIRFIEYITRFLFLRMRATESRDAGCTVACVSKNY